MDFTFGPSAEGHTIRSLRIEDFALDHACVRDHRGHVVRSKKSFAVSKTALRPILMIAQGKSREVIQHADIPR
jgi:hypothetical protein